MLVRTTCSDDPSMHALNRKETLKDSIELVISITCSIGYAPKKKQGEEKMRYTFEEKEPEKPEETEEEDEEEEFEEDEW